MRGFVIRHLVLGERLAVTLNATSGLLEVMIVDANAELIVLRVEQMATLEAKDE